MVARIYSPAKNAMQSGHAKTGYWILQYEPEQAKMIDPLMGYTSSADMKSQLRVQFDTLEEAVAYAKAEGIAYRIEPAHKPNRANVSYSDNFKADRKSPWTH